MDSAGTIWQGCLGGKKRHGQAPEIISQACSFTEATATKLGVTPVSGGCTCWGGRLTK
jgi:hypothetical protein